MTGFDTQILAGPDSWPEESSNGKFDLPDLPVEYRQTHWYAAYTASHHEKRVAEQLNVRAVHSFLPLYTSLRSWKDRRVTLQLPLFPGYVFVHIALRDRLRALQIPGVVRLVGCNGKPDPLPEEEMHTIMNGVGPGLNCEPHPYLTVGRRVRIRKGPLAGLDGIVRRWKGNWRVVLSLDLIQRSIAVDIDSADLEVPNGASCK